MMKQAAVIGAGTMGNGIAHVFAQSGTPVDITAAAASLRAGKRASADLDRSAAGVDSQLVVLERIVTREHRRGAQALERARLFEGESGGLKEALAAFRSRTTQPSLRCCRP